MTYSSGNSLDYSLTFSAGIDTFSSGKANCAPQPLNDDVTKTDLLGHKINASRI
jgi:hypothetical protein